MFLLGPSRGFPDLCLCCHLDEFAFDDLLFGWVEELVDVVVGQDLGQVVVLDVIHFVPHFAILQLSDGECHLYSVDVVDVVLHFRSPRARLPFGGGLTRFDSPCAGGAKVEVGMEVGDHVGS